VKEGLETFCQVQNWHYKKKECSIEPLPMRFPCQHSICIPCCLHVINIPYCSSSLAYQFYDLQANMSPECNKAWAGNVQLPPVMNTGISWGNPSGVLQWGYAHRSPEGQHTETPHPACTLKVINVISMENQKNLKN
jgi:hypothetical protein